MEVGVNVFTGEMLGEKEKDRYVVYRFDITRGTLEKMSGHGGPLAAKAEAKRLNSDSGVGWAFTHGCCTADAWHDALEKLCI